MLAYVWAVSSSLSQAVEIPVSLFSKVWWYGLALLRCPLTPQASVSMAKGEEEETTARLVLDAEAQEVDDATKPRNAALSSGCKWCDIIMGISVL